MDTALIFSVFLLAGFAKGVTGLGLPTIGIALLGLLLPAGQAAALLVLPALVTNVWQIWGGGSLLPLLRRLAPLLGGIVAGTILGGVLDLGPDTARLVLAEVLMLYAMLGLAGFSPRLPMAWEGWAAPLAGLLTGMLTAVTGVFVLPAVPYLQALGLQRDEMVRALGLSFTISTLALAALLISAGHLAVPQMGLSALAVLPALVGMALGGRLRPRLPPRLFRAGFYSLLFGIGVHLLLR